MTKRSRDHYGKYCRKDSIFNLGSAETKLLYTLHWVNENSKFRIKSLKKMKKV